MLAERTAAMTDELLAYLLDDLPPERRAAVEEKLATDFAWQREKQRLEECLAACGDPAKCADEPPQDLVKKTCTLVESSGSHPAIKELQKTPRRNKRSAAFTADSPCLGGGVRSWSFADLTVGGGVLMLVGLLVTPAMFESREASRRTVCQNNLHTFGVALFEYQENRDHHLPEIQPGENAGRYALELLNSGLLTREQLQQLLVCPESPLADDLAAGRISLALPTRAALESASGQQLAGWLKSMGGSYAYRIGYFDEQGAYQPIIYTAEQGSPLMGDAPGLSPDGVRIVNHPGGQNVLLQDLSVPFRAGCVMPRRDHIYLNDDGEHAAGVGPQDIVLIRSEYGPTGPLVPVSE
jgi:hypothetical protein